MTIIAEVVKDINNLIDKSEYYIDKAIEWKEQYPQLSKIYYDTYMDSINKIMAFHSQVVNFIKTDVETDEIDESVLDVMKKVWNFEHIQIIDRIDYLKTKEKRYTKM